MSLNRSLSKTNENFFLRITVANYFGTCGLALSVTHRVQVLSLPVQVSFQSLTSRSGTPCQPASVSLIGYKKFPLNLSYFGDI